MYHRAPAWARRRTAWAREGSRSGALGALVPQATEPAVDALLRALLRVVIALLERADQPIAPALDRGEVVVRELRPLGLDLALELRPARLHLFPRHHGPPRGREALRTRCH